MKKSFGLLAIIMSVLMLAGCGNGNAIEYVPESEAQPVAVVETVSSETVDVEPEEVESEEVESEEESVEQVIVEPEEKGDPALKALEVTEEFAKEHAFTCLYRDGKVYGLSGTTVENCEKYGVGYCHPVALSGVLVTDSYASYFHHYKGTGSRHKDRYVTAGDLPEIVLKEGDIIVNYASNHELKIREAEIVGYTPEWELWEQGSIDLVRYDYDKSEAPVHNKLNTWENFKLEDDNGNVLTEDIGDFKYSLDSSNGTAWRFDYNTEISYDYNGRYWISYIRDFQEYCWDFVANCKIYEIVKDGREYEIDAELNMDMKCYTFDMSQVESGLYCIGNYLVRVP